MELQKLLELLNLEKQQELEKFQTEIQQLTIAQRKEKGFTWYPLQIVKSGYTYGERAFVVVERTTNLMERHRLRSGQLVQLFTQQPEVKRREFAGVINFVDKNKMKIVLNSKDLPDWLNLGTIGVDMLFDERTYFEMEKAVNQVIEAKGDRLADLRDVLLGKTAPRYREVSEFIQNPNLNASQNAAVRQILAAEDVAVVHGPPGTGKTTTLVQAIKQLAQAEHTVLVCAPSNTAVDLLSERCSDAGLNVVRIGNISRVDERIINLTLDQQLAKHPESKNIKKVKIQSADYRKKARKWKRSFGHEDRQERRHLQQQSRELDAWAKQLEDRLITQILASSQVITCTFVGANYSILRDHKFRTCVIDEAAQALEPATWIPILKSSKVVFAGDPYQLPPTVKSFEAARKGFGVTMIEKLIKRLPKVSLLNVQYRMHNAIMGFSNQQFYNGELHADESVENHQLDIDIHFPVEFVDTAGCGFEEKENPELKSRYNPEEFQLLCEHLYQLLDKFEGKDLPEIALISPYREQVVHMQQTVKEDPRLAAISLDINTVDAFQGQERDVIYISLVRSNSKGEIGFLSDYRRMNVAMTRAKKMLIIVGDSGTIGGHEFYGNFLEYVEKEGAYRTAWEFMQP